MADRVDDFLSRLNDPSQFVLEAGVPIFDEHDEPYWCLADGRTEDDDGEPVTKRTPGAERRVKVFDEAELRRIARASNEEDRAGNFSPLSLGHIDPDETREEALPDQVGYAVGYKVQYSDKLKKNVIVTNFAFKAEDYQKAEPFGAISIELWPSGNIWPIALLKRAPQRSLPRWKYHRATPSHPATHPLRFAKRTPGHTLRYSLRTRTMPKTYEDDDTADVFQDDLDAPAMEPEADEATEAKQFMRHCLSHPHAKKYQKMYEMQDAPAAAPDMDDPTMAPDADDPDQYEAAPASSTNIDFPDKKVAKPFSKNGKAATPAKTDKPMRSVKENGEARRYARLEAELAELKDKTLAAEQKAAMADSRRRVEQLLGEGFLIKDADGEVLRFSRKPEAERDEYETYIRDNFNQSPTAPLGRVDLQRTANPSSAPLFGDIDKAHSDRAQVYMRKNRLGSDQWDEAVEKTRK